MAQHPGGKLRDQGAAALTDAELVAILLGAGIPGRPALTIAEDLLARYGSLEALAGRPLEELLDVPGLGDVKILRLAAAFELARRLCLRRPA